jgi:hypothetical protein
VSDETIAAIERKEGEQLRVALRSYNGHSYLDVRVYFQGDRGDWLPTKKGITLNARSAAGLASALDEGIQKLEGRR